MTSNRDIFGLFRPDIASRNIYHFKILRSFLSQHIILYFSVMVRSIVFVKSRIRVSCCFNYVTHSHTSNWYFRSFFFNVIVIQHKYSYNNTHLLSDTIYLLSIVIVQVKSDRGNKFAVRLAAVIVKYFSSMWMSKHLTFVVGTTFTLFQNNQNVFLPLRTSKLRG